MMTDNNDLLYDTMVDEDYSSYDDETIWTTADGTEIALVDMNDSHLANAIRYMTKKEAAMDSSGYEMAPNGMDVAIGREHEEVQTKLGLLEEEAERRQMMTQEQVVS